MMAKHDDQRSSSILEELYKIDMELMNFTKKVNQNGRTRTAIIRKELAITEMKPVCHRGLTTGPNSLKKCNDMQPNSGNFELTRSVMVDCTRSVMVNRLNPSGIGCHVSTSLCEGGRRHADCLPLTPLRSCMKKSFLRVQQSLAKKDSKGSPTVLSEKQRRVGFFVDDD